MYIGGGGGAEGRILGMLQHKQVSHGPRREKTCLRGF